MTDTEVPKYIWKQHFRSLAKLVPKATCVELKGDEGNRNSSASRSTFSSSDSSLSRSNRGDLAALRPDPEKCIYFNSYPASTRGDISPTSKDEESNCTKDCNAGRTFTDYPFGRAFHGFLTQSQCSEKLKSDGQYLVRRIKGNSGKVLTLREAGQIRNFCITFNENENVYLLENGKSFTSLDELVQDGLNTLYITRTSGRYIDFMYDITMKYSTKNMNRLNSVSQDTLLSSIVTENDKLRGQDRSTKETRKSPSPLLILSDNLSDKDWMKGAGAPHSFHYLNEPDSDLTPCKVCEQYIWHGNGQKMKCIDCGQKGHEKCIREHLNLFDTCKVDLNRVENVFTADLNLLVKANGGKKPPFILEKCIKVIESRGLNIQGIYRVSATQENIRKVKNILETDLARANLEVCEDIHSICGVVKKYLMNIPCPLLPPDTLNHLRDIINIKEAENDEELDVGSVRKEFRKLPHGHAVTLSFMLRHLYLVSRNHETNLMGVHNLSVIFAPTMAREWCNPEENLKTAISGILEPLIANVPKIYSIPSSG